MSFDPRETIRENVRRGMEAGVSLSKLSRQELESLLHEFLSHNVTGREFVGDLVEEVRARSRRGMDYLGEFIRAEVHREVESIINARRAEASDRFERAVSTFGEYLRAPFSTRPARDQPPSDWRHQSGPSPTDEVSAPAQSAVKTSGSATSPKSVGRAKKATAKKSPAKKTPAKKAAAKKTPAKKAPAGAARVPATAKRRAPRKANPGTAEQAPTDGET